MAKKVKDPNKKSLWAEFKEFINKGNAFMLAVGVVIGGAFNAIVTALVNILMSIATWWVPGGLKGLVTVLPAANAAQKGMLIDGEYYQMFYADQFTDLAKKIGEAAGAADPVLYGKSVLESKFTLHGAKYTYNMAAVIDWGTFINAVIAFLIIAVTLFVIVKVTTVLAKKREEAKAAIAAKVAAKANGEAEEAEEAPAEEEAK